jgi:hypothetical protein
LAGLAAAALLALGCGSGDGSTQSRPGAAAPSGHGAGALLAAPCPEPEGAGVATGSPDRREIAAARAGRFTIYNGVALRLEPPIDWHADPLDALRFRDTFQKLRFLNPLLYDYAVNGNRAALRQALAVVLDWVRSNPRGGAGTAPEAWIDKVTGDRVPLIAYVTRAAACEDMLSRFQARELLDSMRRHAQLLAAVGGRDTTNHGLFADLGLALVTDYFPFLAGSDQRLELAERQFLKTLRGRLAEGVWLEQSTAYQFLAIRAVERFVAYTGDQQAEEVLARMKRAAAWFVEPDNEMTQFGDSYLFPVPPWGLRIADRLRGLEAFPRAGFAFVRAPGRDEAGDGYLAVASDFHNTTHKHADELSFELYDHGHRIVSDTGLYHKDPGPIRDFVLSARAHSVLTVDRQGFPILDPSKAYGSGLVGTGRGDGWFAIEGTNPLLRDQGVRHTRLFLYRPREALVVVDDVSSASSHEYTRRFQLGPDVGISDRGPSVTALRAPGLHGRLYDAPAPERAARTEVRGSHKPLAGLTSPHFRVFEPRWTVSYDSRAADAAYATTFAFDPPTLRARVERLGAGGATVELHGTGSQPIVLRVTRSGRTLSVRER